MLPLGGGAFQASRGCIGEGGLGPSSLPIPHVPTEVKALGFAMEQVTKEVPAGLQSKQAVLEKRRQIAKDLHVPVSQVKVCTMEVTNHFVDTVRGPGAGNFTET
mmetsp:Transcript_50563/g.158255  ORF Transcript_50563/g.158255 Transcript_50563/m.158255 type:complete len:104 (-) Transcript_50563:79-390(-)